VEAGFKGFNPYGSVAPGRCPAAPFGRAIREAARPVLLARYCTWMLTALLVVPSGNVSDTCTVPGGQFCGIGTLTWYKPA
jgi:hypothetical protein